MILAWLARLLLFDQIGDISINVSKKDTVSVWFIQQNANSTLSSPVVLAADVHVKCDDSVMTVPLIHLRASSLVKLSARLISNTTLLATGLMEWQPSEIDNLKKKWRESFSCKLETVYSFPWQVTEHVLICVRVVFVLVPLPGSMWTSRRSTATWPAARLSYRAPSSLCRGRIAASRSSTTKCMWDWSPAVDFTFRAVGKLANIWNSAKCLSPPRL